MRNITMYDYIISNNASAIRPLLKKYGKNYPDNWNSYSEADKIAIIKATMRKLIDNDNFRKDLISLHPDVEVIEEYLNTKNSNKFFSADGDEAPKIKVSEGIKKLDKENKENTLNIPKISNLLLGVGIGIGAIYIIKNVIK